MPLPLKKKNRNRSRRPFSSSRLLESNGPDIKIKGSALQIVEKYISLSREYQSSGDPITAESYLQYAEHYQRIVDANDFKIQQNQANLLRSTGLKESRFSTIRRWKHKKNENYIMLCMVWYVDIENDEIEIIAKPIDHQIQDSLFAN